MAQGAARSVVLREERGVPSAPEAPVIKLDARLTAAAFATTFALSAAARGQQIAERSASEAGTIDRVVMYPTGAAVTRALHRELAQGLWTVRVTNLPEGVDPRRLQARLRTGDAPVDGGPRLLGVEYEEAPGIDFAGSPEGVELATKLKDARTRLERAQQDLAQLAQDDARIEQVGVRTAANATADGGTAKAEPAKAIEQLAWVQERKAKSLAVRRELDELVEATQREIGALEATIAQRGAAGRVQRAAVVRIAAPTACEADLDVTYFVNAARWSPAYAIRAAGDRSATGIEYDAVLVQQSGEEWKDVRVSLSTANPDDAAQPGEVAPVYVDVRQPSYGLVGAVADPGEGGAFGGRPRSAKRGKPGRPSGGPGGGGLGTGGDDDGGAPDGERADELARLAGGASVADAGIAATFELPRRVTVPSDARRSQRTRITTIEPTCTFVYVAEPLMTESVYLRGDLVNASQYQLLPGPADISMGGDFIGTTPMPSVAPGSPFKVFFGPDRAVRAKREVVSKVTGAAGLFGGSVATTWKYRITLDNGTGRDLRLELVDRRPVSRNEKIEVKVADLSSPLSTDAEYAAGPQKSGILRWDLAVPAAARGKAALPVTWTVQATHAKDIQTTPLPD